MSLRFLTIDSLICLSININHHYLRETERREREGEGGREREKHIVESKGIKEIIQHKKIQI